MLQINQQQRTAIKMFIVEDELLQGKVMQRAIEDKTNIDVSLFSSAEECFNNMHLKPDIISIDYNLPDMNGLDLIQKIKSFDETVFIIMLSGQAELEVVVKAYKQGVNDYIIKNETSLTELLNSVKNLTSTISLKREVNRLKEQIIDRNKYSNIIGNSPAILNILKFINKVEQTNLRVLVTGESGTGKELVANALHYNSPRKKKPFIAVNMAAIPDDLIESELFGHEKGAFTGAVERRIGKFEEANGGTIFLDEIGEVNMEVQKKLLRVLQENEIVRIGSNKVIKLDLRVIAATNKNLDEEVKSKRFREDLFYRLQGFTIPLPPLRERGDDIILLAKHFLKQFAADNHLGQITLSKETIKEFMEYSWPGNIRELRSLIERAALLCENQTIQPEDCQVAFKF